MQYEKGVLKNFAKVTGKHVNACNCTEKETVAQVVSVNFAKCFKNSYFINI